MDVVGNTVARNLTTATAVTSDGTRGPGRAVHGDEQRPAPAAPASAAVPGVADAGGHRPSASRRSSTTCSGTTGPAPTAAARITGIGVLPDGIDGGVEQLGHGHDRRPGRPARADRDSVLQTDARHGRQPDLAGHQRGHRRPRLKDPYALSVDVLASRTYPAFRQASVIAELLPPNLMGDYHLTGTGSPASGASASKTVTWGTGATRPVHGADPTRRHRRAGPADRHPADAAPTSTP